jgi:hypothetical protein
MSVCNDVTRDLGDLQREPPVAGGLSRPIFTTSSARAQDEGTSDLQSADRETCLEKGAAAASDR